MRSNTLAFALALSLAAPVAAVAQEGTASGAAGGAATGAVLGGPVGAAAGAVAGGVIGTAIAPPKVKEYVVHEQRPSVRYEGEVVVGKALPEDVEVYQVPDSDYSYTVVNDRRYIVDSHRKVVEVVE
ncbi:DUF1236 domain-containing protein [Hansschlegelia sp.]|uniref:DUF1236 domain-containing protein n=1 Tax=Hansschlegelia sp. TaxID=2041892 RepID=UPI002B6AFE23|nr:DUF1236 domain-containing protein [Hansschlegelia sp.]HVI28234.1 DUF1236 domain-containing protein [Hansschlegelia sp.]